MSISAIYLNFLFFFDPKIPNWGLKSAILKLFTTN